MFYSRSVKDIKSFCAFKAPDRRISLLTAVYR